MSMKRLTGWMLAVTCALGAPAAWAQEDDNEGVPTDARVQIEDVPGLPRVLIIGDSISLGYTLPVRELLKGKANVHRPPANCGGTIQGIRNIETWLGDGNWDLIHFNWGLWDINRRVNGKRNADGPITTTEEQYAKQLEKLVMRLKETGATLVWASTTYVQGGWGRRQGDDVRYNEIAREIMERHGVRINDLHALSATFPHFGEGPAGAPEMFTSKGNVHFTGIGSQRLAEQVATAIEQALAARK
ncbi:MAG TPA: SGNH/GDSL hydrolase family protein [Kiritimatiellia bacterium]|nr:SGNH/GDSL hydrolase family protein [Kiritimatiellia bacterium]